MRKMVFAASVAASVMVLAGCEKTGENEFEVERPTVGTTTDTVRVPDVDVRTGRDTITVPTVDVDVNKSGGDVRDTTRRTKTPTKTP